MADRLSMPARAPLIPLISSQTAVSSAGPLVVVLAIVLLPPLIAYYVYRDYRAFLALGAGGTPQTFIGGYLRIKLLSLFALRSPRSPAPIPADLRQTGYLTCLPARRGPRPDVVGIAPHRQTTQKAPVSTAAYTALAMRLRALASDPANELVEDTSCFEKHGTGLFSRSPLTHTCRGEVCHVHGSDGSLHMTLYPADAKLVIEKGWGERHPIARGGFFSHFVPRHFVMVYAPRDEVEVDVVVRIVGAAVWWVSGVCVARRKGSVRDGRSGSECDARMVNNIRKAGGEIDWIGDEAAMAALCLGCHQRQYGSMQACS